MEWKREHTEFTDVLYEKGAEIAKITINRPDKRNAVRRQTTKEMEIAFLDAWHDDGIGVVVVTGVGNAFCSGGDVSERDPETGRYAGVEWDGLGTMIHYLIRNIPKPVIAMVNGYAIGGGQVYQLMCDLSIASEKAVFGQVGPRFGSFDAGFGAAYLARVVGEKKAREIWYMCRQYDAKEALEMGLVNAVVPLDQLEDEGVKWAKEMLRNSPLALRLMKSSFNAELDGMVGITDLAHNANMLFYMSDEGNEGRDAFLQKREPRYSDLKAFPRRP